MLRKSARLILNALAALSLLLCVAAAAECVRSYRASASLHREWKPQGESIDPRFAYGFFGATSAAGTLAVGRGVLPSRPPEKAAWHWQIGPPHHFIVIPDDTFWRRAGLGYTGIGEPGDAYYNRWYFVPWPLIVAAAALLPGARLWLWGRRRLQRAGDLGQDHPGPALTRCPGCGAPLPPVRDAFCPECRQPLSP